ncbi:hypothetical protein [Cohnella sp. REN36]|uniref:hypothetical protein n=1 Tax=Cohnella sp. REN36 TaxID=2887347 RepID=UPI001D15BC43|nr:hypothetical protein [Cohnella sp. REN36]
MKEAIVADALLQVSVQVGILVGYRLPRPAPLRLDQQHDDDEGRQPSENDMRYFALMPNMKAQMKSKIHDLEDESDDTVGQDV